jgi:hypothetical protein
MQQPMDATLTMPPHLPVDYPGGPHMMGNLGPGVPQFVHMHGKKILVFTPFQYPICFVYDWPVFFPLSDCFVPQLPSQINHVS